MKLIRDRTPGLLPNSTRRVRDVEEHRQLLRAKLMEEAAEVSASTSLEEMTEELGDLFTVIEALQALEGIDALAVTLQQHAKRELKGGFEGGTVLVYDPLENKHG